MATLTAAVVGATLQKNGSGQHELLFQIRAIATPGQVAVLGNSGPPDAISARQPANLLGRVCSVVVDDVTGQVTSIAIT